MYRHSPEMSAGEQALPLIDFRQIITEFIQTDPNDNAVSAAFMAAEAGHWGYIPATGIEWPCSDDRYGPQRVTIDTTKTFAGQIVTGSDFEDDITRAKLLAGGEVFGVHEADNSMTVWQPVIDSTGQWPLFRRFMLPERSATLSTGGGEIGPVDYALVPYLQLPSAMPS